MHFAVAAHITTAQLAHFVSRHTLHLRHFSTYMKHLLVHARIPRSHKSTYFNSNVWETHVTHMLTSIWVHNSPSAHQPQTHRHTHIEHICQNYTPEALFGVAANQFISIYARPRVFTFCTFACFAYCLLRKMNTERTLV